jgi:tetratricopeptide (TPR) repeat protein
MDAQEYMKRGIEFFNQDDFDRAIADFTEAFRLDPELVGAKNNLCTTYYNRGVASFRKGDIDRAIADLTEAVALNPNDVTAYGARGTIRKEMGDYDGVINDFTKVIQLAPSVAAYFFRGNAYLEKGIEAREAGDKNGFLKYNALQIKDYEAALQIDPDNEDCQKMLKLATEERDLRKGTYEYMEEVGEIFGG